MAATVTMLYQLKLQFRRTQSAKHQEARDYAKLLGHTCKPMHGATTYLIIFASSPGELLLYLSTYSEHVPEASRKQLRKSGAFE